MSGSILGFPYFGKLPNILNPKIPKSETLHPKLPKSLNIKSLNPKPKIPKPSNLEEILQWS